MSVPFHADKYLLHFFLSARVPLEAGAVDVVLDVVASLGAGVSGVGEFMKD